MTTKNTDFITFDEFMYNLGIQRKREGLEQIPKRYECLNEVLDAMLESPKTELEEIFSKIATKKNISIQELKEEILLGMKEIFSRKEQKEMFKEIFKNKSIAKNVEKFLYTIVKAYEKKNSF